jgi:hypothetical protein
MKTVFVVQHLHVLHDGQENVKMIGVYSSLEAARAAVDRLKGQPGFRDYPRLVDPLTDTDADASGFYIEAYPLDKDNWTEGFVTV